LDDGCLILNSTYDLSIDYFAVIGVHYGACEKTVKMMYRKMARRYHPDVSTIHDAQKRFQDISAAYEILKKHRDAYCIDHERHKRSVSSHRSQAKSQTDSAARKARYSEPPPKSDSHSENRQQSEGYSWQTYRTRKPIDGKDRIITYPLTLRYAIRLLKLGSFYIPGLKVKMKFSREAFEGKTFRLEGKGYGGLFGGKNGDFLVRFNIKLDNVRFQLEAGDIYGVFSVPTSLLQEGKKVKLESPSGWLNFTVPISYSPSDYIKVPAMGLPADELLSAGDFYARLVTA
jgi:curved DNA-binding protein